MPTDDLAKLLDVAVHATKTDPEDVLSRSRVRIHVDARCLFVHLARTRMDRWEGYRVIGTRINRNPSDAGHLARRAERLLRPNQQGHPRDFRLYLARATAELEKLTQ